MYFSSQGKATRQAHKGIPEGHFEEEQGRRGFFGPVSHLIPEVTFYALEKIDGPLKPRMFDLVKHAEGAKRQRLLYNADVTLYMEWVMPRAAKKEAMRATRNADGDTIYFCHKGKGVVLTEYGLLAYRPGDYVMLPKCLAHVIMPDEASQFLIIENLTSDFREPDRGIAGRHAVYDVAQLDKPSLDEQEEWFQKHKDASVVYVDVQHNHEITKFEYEENIFDVVGWHGDFFPFKLNMDQIMPLMSHRAHLPPSAHTTFVAQNFVVCSFVPRPLESDADALRVPFYHQNIDYDEVLFLSQWRFLLARESALRNAELSPSWLSAWANPKAIDKVKGVTHTNEYAVMVDTRRPLIRDAYMDIVEVAEYWKSWQA